MAYFMVFVIGFTLGAWCNGPKAYERGERWGKWTRAHILRLPPLTAPVTTEKGNG